MKHPLPALHSPSRGSSRNRITLAFFCSEGSSFFSKEEFSEWKIAKKKENKNGEFENFGSRRQPDISA